MTSRSPSSLISKVEAAAVLCLRPGALAVMLADLGMCPSMQMVLGGASHDYDEFLSQ